MGTVNKNIIREMKLKKDGRHIFQLDPSNPDHMTPNTANKHQEARRCLSIVEVFQTRKQAMVSLG